MKRTTTLIQAGVLAALLTLTACSSTPEAPTVSESHRRPVNSTEAIELQSCRGQLKNTEVLLQETSRLASSATAALTGAAAQCARMRQSTPATPPSTPANPADPSANAMTVAPSSNVFVLLFPFGSTSIDLLESASLQLATASKNAALIEIRGRTDGTVASAGNERVARGRALAVRDYLVSVGVPADRIRVTFQPIGDYVADNNTTEGRALNRRAEVALYASVPHREVLASRPSVDNSQGDFYVSSRR